MTVSQARTRWSRGQCGRQMATAAIVMAGLTCSAAADPVEDFYRGKVINVFIGVNVGGGYDLEARLVARFMGKYIPGHPNLVPQNMVGAGGITMANYLYNVAAKDGTNIGMFPNTLIALQAVHGRGVQYDARNFIWLGTVATSPITLATWYTRGVDTWKDLLSKKVIVAASARGAITYTFPYLANEMLGTKLQIITGYQGTSQMILAMEKGEVDAVVNSWSSWKSIQPEWLQENKLKIVLQGEPRSNELPQVPTIDDLVTGTENKTLVQLVLGGDELGKPMALPPGVPADRANALRAAYAATVRDPDFQKAAAEQRIDVNPVSGETIGGLVSRILATPDNIAEKAKDLIQ